MPATLALTGFLEFVGQDCPDLPALEDAEKISVPWILLARPCLRFELEELAKLGEVPGLKNWAPLFYLSQLSFTGNEPETLKLQRALLECFPDCVRIWTTPAYYWGVVDPIPGRWQSQQAIGSRLYHRLRSMDGFPRSLDACMAEGAVFGGDSWTEEEFQVRGKLLQALTAVDGVGSPADDPRELSWQVLGSLIRELTFTQAVFLASSLQSTGTDSSRLDFQVETTEPALRDHRFWDMLEAYHCGQRGRDASARLVADPATIGDRYYRITDFDMPLYMGVRDDALRTWWRGASPRLQLQYLMPNARNQFYKNVRESLRQPLTDENNSTGIVDRIAVPPDNPWMVMYRVQREWEELDHPEQVERWWDGFARFPGVRRSIVLQAARTGQTEDALRRISEQPSLLDEPDWTLYETLARLHLRNGDLEEFAATIRRFLEHPALDNPADVADAGYLGGYTLLVHGQAGQAEHFFQRAAETGTDIGLRCQALLSEARGRGNEAEALYRNRVRDRAVPAIDWYWACVRTGCGDVQQAEATVRANCEQYQPMLRSHSALGSLWRDYNVWAFAVGAEEPEEIVRRFARDAANPLPRMLAFLSSMMVPPGDRADRLARPTPGMPGAAGSQNPTSMAMARLADLLEQKVGGTAAGRLTDQEIDTVLEPASLLDKVQMLYAVGKYLDLTGQQDRVIRYWQRAAEIPALADYGYQLAVLELSRRKATGAGVDSPPVRRSSE